MADTIYGRVNSTLWRGFISDPVDHLYYPHASSLISETKISEPLLIWTSLSHTSCRGQSPETLEPLAIAACAGGELLTPAVPKANITSKAIFNQLFLGTMKHALIKTRVLQAIASNYYKS